MARPRTRTFYVGFGEVKQWFDGRIDEVAYYSKALDADRVYQHFLADPAADEHAGGDGGGSGGGSGDSGGGGSSGGSGSGGGGTANAPAKLGLRLGKSVTPAGKKAMVPVFAGDQPASGTVSIAAGKTRLGKASFELDQGDDSFVNVKLSKKHLKTFRKQRSVIVTVDADTGTVKERLPVGR